MCISVIILLHTMSDCIPAPPTHQMDDAAAARDGYEQAPSGEVEMA
jgi:hypothetical protein